MTEPNKAGSDDPDDVRFRGVERTWACGLHMSAFDPSGHWPVGPLTTGLAALETPHKKYHRQGSAPGVGD